MTGGHPTGRCQPVVHQVTVPKCVFGDPNGSHTMVLYGDSHALMWFRAMNQIAIRAHWRLVILGKGLLHGQQVSIGKRLELRTSSFAPAAIGRGSLITASRNSIPIS